MSDTTGERKFSFKRNLSLRKSDGSGSSGQSSWKMINTKPLGLGDSANPNYFKPPLKDSNSAQMSMTSFFNKTSSAPSSQSSAGYASSNPSPSGNSIKSFFQQTSKPIAQVAPLGNSIPQTITKAPAGTENKGPITSPGLVVSLDDLDDDDDFDFSSVKFTPKPKVSAINKSVTDQGENRQSDDEDVVIGSAKRKGKRKMVISDDEDEGETGSEPVQENNLPLPTMPLFTQSDDDNELLESEAQKQSDEDDDNWGYMDIPPASPPPDHILQAELETQEIDEFETEDVGAELAFADGLIKKPVVTKPAPAPHKPPMKRPRQETVAPSFRNFQQMPCKPMQANTSAAQENNEATCSNETLDKVKHLLKEQDDLLERICGLIKGFKLEHLMTMEGVDFQEIPKILMTRESLKKEYSQISSRLEEIKNSKKVETTSHMSTFKSPMNVASAFKSPANSVSFSKNIRNEQTPTLLKTPNTDRNISKTDEQLNSSEFDLPPCGDSFFDDPHQLPSTLASFVKSTSAKNSPNLSVSSVQRTCGIANNAEMEALFNSASAVTPKPFKFDYSIGAASTSKQDAANEFDEQFTDSMFDDMEEEANVMNMTNATPSTSANVTPGKPMNSASKTGFSPSGTIHRRSQIQDDSCSGQFDGFNFPHSEEMLNVFQGVFGLRDFRTNQLQAINASLLGNDCFILMPTGGGKSLCYQLPALVTPGVTVVVSPLRSLIQDQVQRLCSLNIGASHLSGEVTANEAKAIYNRLFLKTPDISLLYVTPEKICASERFISVLQHLYQRQKLRRFVIDEAHCVSQWGHDFRPDYKRLNMLREKFPGVPMMAVTATATPRVRKDILHQLGMKDCKWFCQSFNRPNLKFMVRPKKSKNLTKDIIELITKEFRNKSGIVYCLSRNECDQTAKDLRSAGIAAESYHAGLKDDQRNTIQERWLNERNCKVVCATIAFGMGIDKPDVRFVLHYSLPKSVEGYYQECGRAGRDGRLATCILYYAYSDVIRLRRIIEMDPSANYEAKKVHLDNLYRMVQFGENCVECRRTQMLDYFGEQFDRSQCSQMPGAICDNCASKDVFSTEDVTDEVKEIVKGIDQVVGSGRFTNNYTLIHFMEIYKGSKNAKVIEAGHDKLAIHGRGKKHNYIKTDVERLFRHLVVEGILAEQLHITAQEHTVCYIKLGPRARDVLNGRLKVKFQFQKKSGKTTADKPIVIKEDPAEDLKNECYENLVQLAKQIAEEMGYKSYNMVFSSDALTEMSQTLPITEDDMEKISGVGKVRMRNYGDRFLAITTNYALLIADLDDMPESNGIAESVHFTEEPSRDDGDAEAEDLMEGSRYFHHEPSIVYEGGKRGGRGGKRFGYKKKGFGRGRGKKRGGGAGRGSSSGGWLSKSSGSASASGGGFSSFTSKPRGGRGRGRASSTTTSSTGRKPGIMGAPKSSRSFLGGSGTFFG